jgi:hypothetical protein
MGNCFHPLVLPLQQLTNVTKLGVNWIQWQWAEHLPEQLQVGRTPALQGHMCVAVFPSKNQ